MVRVEVGEVGEVQVRNFYGPWDVFGILFLLQWAVIRRLKAGE